MIRKRAASAYFWLLIGITAGLAWLGLRFGEASVQIWLEALWQTCQNGWRYLVDTPSVTGPMFISLILLTILVRAVWSVTRQSRATRRITHLFLPLRAELPDRVRVRLREHQLAGDDVVFLDVKTVHAFCLGFRRPRIWLTAGLVDLLSDDELAAVLAHEVRHLRQRDPLRLLIGRTLKSAFFFLPLIRSLADAAELQQEIEADHYAVVRLGDDLPLLSALQKMLDHGHTPTLAKPVAYTPFNLTEARLKRLIYPPTPINWSRLFFSGLVNLMILLALSSTLYFTCLHPVAPPLEVGACIADTLQSTSSSLPITNYNW